MPDVSIAISAQDSYTSALKSMAAVTRAFDKNAEVMERTLHKLNTTKYSLKLDAGKALKSLKEMEKQFEATGDEADGLKMQLAQANYDNIKRNLDLVTKGAKETEKEMQRMEGTFRRVDNKMAGGGFSSIVGAIATSGAVNMLSGVALDASKTLVGSALGDTAGTLASSVISSVASGAAMGAVVGHPLIGAGIGAISGALSGASQTFQKQDDAFKSYVSDQYDAIMERRASELSSGSTIAAGREKDLISFSTLFKGRGKAEGYLNDLVKMANTTPFLYDDLTAMSKTLATYGYHEKSILPVLETIGDTGAALGMSTSDMTTVAQAIGRMKSSNKTTLEYLNMLNDRGIGAVGMLADSYGVDQGKMYDMISKGEVAGSKAAEIILAAMADSFAGSMSEQSQTFLGLTSTLEGWQQEMANAAGAAYNEVRSEGIGYQIKHFEGKDGEALEEMNGIIGAGHAYQENLREQYQREAEAAVLRGVRSFIYDEEQRGMLDEMHSQYLAAKESYDKAVSFGDTEGAAIYSAEVEKLKGSIENFAEDAFNASAGIEEIHDVQLDLIAAIRENTDALGGWQQQYREGQEKSVGSADVSGIFRVGMDFSAARANAMGLGTPYGPPKAFGLNRVPYDNFPALLHQGERVLTASQARQADLGGGVHIGKLADTVVVREEADLDRLARKFAAEVQRAALLAVP